MAFKNRQNDKNKVFGGTANQVSWVELLKCSCLSNIGACSLWYSTIWFAFYNQPCQISQYFTPGRHKLGTPLKNKVLWKF